MKLYNVTIETLDGSPITKRTGKSKCNAQCSQLPYDGGYIMFFYQNEDCESPGVAIGTDQVEKLNNEYRFLSTDKTPFRLVVQEELDC